MKQKEFIAAVEALLFASGDPISAHRLSAVLGSNVEAVETALQALRRKYEAEDSGLCLLHLNENWQLATRQEYAFWVRKLLDQRRSVPLSAAAMETLTVIAYNQPVSRSFVEQVRGVDCATSVAGLVDKGLIEEAGRLNLPGRPISYKTTDKFLRLFGLSTLEDLPPIHDAAGNLAEDDAPAEPARHKPRKKGGTE